ncbi:MAG: amidohydrolase [Ruminococcaceae bacterium]|nr:amidohydrolase [Oscillospiraceae bacterium]
MENQIDTKRKELLFGNISRHRQLTLNACQYIWENPETGFREWKAHRYLWDAFTALGYSPVAAGNIPGFYADIDTGRPGPTVLVFGELDALLVEGHPDADPETGAVHACGHCCQAAALLGLAAALKEPGSLEGLCGKIRLTAVPAEELIEIEYREQLRRDGIIHYYGGKPEFMYRGMLDGADVAMMCHSASIPSHVGAIRGGGNGFITKQITYMGRSSHAGGAPHAGVNALYAANQGLNSINALRETFRDNAHIRVHPIITKGGTAVNAIPDCVTMECYVRGASMEAIRSANQKVNRALAASAAALGAEVMLQDRPGYSPRSRSLAFLELARDAMESFLVKTSYGPDTWSGGSTDLGDVSCVMPVIHPLIGGVVGGAHGVDYRIADPEAACLDIVRFHMLALELLLRNDARRCYSIMEDYQPPFTGIGEYLAYTNGFILDRNAVRYDGHGNVLLNLGTEEKTI